MHVITHRRITEAMKQHADCATALDQWYRVMKKARLADFAEMRNLFNSVDKVNDVYVFNVGGNKLRIIAAVHFNTGKVFIRWVLTHSEYDKGRWRVR
ncbi:type II toxin-antitoxin system HigB family toxin [Acidithiobacillus sp. IBUN Pt1247-S3]|uniref:type II toxin-antitoxin system HigB family toxin n=1 Tax=Acidithiobacillus sp. IBUN Pt1247-S3 TaxID=3166642 RepID=UPI0034E45E81